MTATAEDKIITEFELDRLTDVADTPAEGQDSETASAEPAPAASDTAVALRIVKGEPTDEEIAALVAVLSAAAASASEPEGDGKPPETWGDPTRMHRQWAPFSPYSYPNRG